jgi:SAM-dependent methyltransferase
LFTLSRGKPLGSRGILNLDFSIIIVYFSLVGSKQNELTLKQILITTENLSKKTDGLFLKKEFKQVLPDDLKNKLRSLHNTKSTVNSRFHGDDNFYAKYARDLDTNWVRNIDRFVSLGLIKKSRILDIGCGFGLFSHIAEFNGHKVDSVDMANASPILKKATKLLNIKKHEFTVKKNTPLLKFKYKFDVVSAFQIFFNGHASKDLWDVEEWKFFLMDLHDNILNDNGVVTLVFNGEHRNLEPIIVNGETLFLGKNHLKNFLNLFLLPLLVWLVQIIK